MQQTGTRSAQAAQDIGKALQPVAASVAAQECTCDQGNASYLYLRAPKAPPADPDPCPVVIGGVHPGKPLPKTTERIEQFTEFIRRVHAEVPGSEQTDDTWLKWFAQFERLLQPLQRISDELEATIEAMR